MDDVATRTWLLKEGAGRLGVELSQDAIDRFLTFLEELILWNAKIDLISQTDPATIIRKHFLDSIAVLPYISGTPSILDLGSGAGFPGVPLAILLPASSVSLIEARRKRVSFLRQTARKINGTNLTVHEGRAEILAEENILRNAFDIVISRATWDILTFLRLAVPFLRSRGKIFAMRGPQKDESMFFLPAIQRETCDVRQHDYVLPFGTEKRKLLIFEYNVSRAT